MGPEERDGSSDLHERREIVKVVIPRRYLVDNLLGFDVVGNVPFVGNPSLQESSAGKITRTPSDQGDIERTTENRKFLWNR